MPTVVPVKFEYAARGLWFDPKESGVLEGDRYLSDRSSAGCDRWLILDFSGGLVKTNK